MKKLLIVALTILLCNVAQSQLFIGGSFGVSSSSSEFESGTTTVEGNKHFNFNLVPKAGYFLNDQFAIGAGIGINTGKVTEPGTPNDPLDPDVETSTFEFVFNPFARYYAINVGSLSIFAEGGIDLGFGSSKVTAGTVSNDGPSTTSFTIYVAPAISYALSEKLSIEAQFGGVYFNSVSEKTDVTTGAGTSTDTDKYSGFGFGLNPSSISFGIIYKL